MIQVYTYTVDKAMDVLLADLIKCFYDNYYLLQNYFKSADITTRKLTHRLMILTDRSSIKEKVLPFFYRKIFTILFYNL